MPRRPTEHDFTSRLRSPAVSARVGLWLGVAFAVAFLTGLVSHWAQSPDPWLPFPNRPVWGYRVTQGLHVASGTAAVPLLLVKLYSVFPKLFQDIPRPSRALVVHALERLSILVLVAAAIFQLVTGLLNASQWYPWAFSFRATHYAVAWVAIGALVVHVAVKLPVIRGAFGAPLESTELDRDSVAEHSAMSRRALLGTTGVAAGSAVLLSIGSAVPWLREVSVFGVRSGKGPGGVPINKSARAAQVTVTALDPSYRLELINGPTVMRLTREDLQQMVQTSAELPIACVEGWSASGLWTGVRVRDLIALVGAANRDVRIESLQPEGPFRATLLPAHFAADELTLLALQLNEEELSIDHGYPVRLIAPNRPGVLQTKWVHRLEVR